jgi:hypothetical protein
MTYIISTVLLMSLIISAKTELRWDCAAWRNINFDYDYRSTKSDNDYLLQSLSFCYYDYNYDCMIMIHIFFRLRLWFRKNRSQLKSIIRRPQAWPMVCDNAFFFGGRGWLEISIWNFHKHRKRDTKKCFFYTDLHFPIDVP